MTIAPSWSARVKRECWGLSLFTHHAQLCAIYDNAAVGTSQEYRNILAQVPEVFANKDWHLARKLPHFHQLRFIASAIALESGHLLARALLWDLWDQLLHSVT